MQLHWVRHNTRWRSFHRCAPSLQLKEHFLIYRMHCGVSTQKAPHHETSEKLERKLGTGRRGNAGAGANRFWCGGRGGRGGVGGCCAGRHRPAAQVHTRPSVSLFWHGRIATTLSSVVADLLCFSIFATYCLAKLDSDLRLKRRDLCTGEASRCRLRAATRRPRWPSTSTALASSAGTKYTAPPTMSTRCALVLLLSPQT